MATPRSTLLIACGALAREILALRQAAGWDHLTVDCLPAHYHNTPDVIAPAVQGKIRENRGRYGRIFVVYGDCGTSGALDRVLAEEGIERMPGPHCYEFYAGSAAYATMMEAELGTFFLTDYMVRHFDRLIIEGLWLDRHPELLGQYFRNYRKLVYLAQIEDAELQEKAAAAAARLGLAYEYRFTGFGGLADRLREVAAMPVATTPAGSSVAIRSRASPPKRNLSLSRRRARARRRNAAV